LKTDRYRAGKRKKLTRRGDKTGNVPRPAQNYYARDRAAAAMIVRKMLGIL
jgi:hypothetical protein